jgi:uracil phosphoribosyltransferase
MENVKNMKNVRVMDHPLIQHKIGILRRVETGSKEFRELASEISMLMCYEATRNLPLKDVEIETPLTKTVAKQIAGRTLGLVPILRAGLGMVDAMLNLVPTAKVGHIGLYRDPETLNPVEYYCKLPYDAAERDIFVLDPMLATGGSASAAIQFIKDKGVERIYFLCLIAAPEGIARLTQDHPDVEIFVAALDDQLNDHGYIVPGLGDMGDRLFGTK